MRLLDRYLLRELLLPLGYCLGGFLIFWISSDLISEISRFQKNHLSAADIAEYYLVTAPEVLRDILPIVLLLALLYALTNHARHNELTAMRAAGISLWRFSAPYFAVGLFFTAAYFFINEYWVPKSVDRANAILQRHDPAESKSTTGDWRRDLKFLNSRDNRAWWIKEYNVKTSQMRAVLIDWNFPDGKRSVISAKLASFSDGVWKFMDVEQSSYTSREDITPSKFSTNEIEFSDWVETPELIQSEIKISGLNSKQAVKKPQLSIADILNYLQIHPRLDKTTRALVNTQLHGRIAAPWTCLVVVFIALPFGALSGRRNVFVGVASSIFICFAYFILLRVGLALGISGRLPPWLAAWLPNILFGVSAIWMTLRVR
jgi:lipopolysaccharide export system permease protein